MSEDQKKRGRRGAKYKDGAKEMRKQMTTRDVRG